MDLTRQSYEVTNEFTSAAMLSRLESTHSRVGHANNANEDDNANNGNTGNTGNTGTGIVERIRRRTRGKSFKAKSPFAQKDNNINEGEPTP